jgi:hypothetical protein
MCFLLALLFSLNAKAYVFDFSSRTFSTYLRTTGGLNSLQRNAYAPGEPNTVSFTDNNGVNSQISVEIGVAFTKPKAFTTRFGVEVLYPYTASGVTGKNSGGAPLFSLNSQIYSIIPQLNFEYFVKQKDNWRIYLGGGAGYALTTLQNSYTMTPQGQSTLGVGSYSEVATGTSIMGQGFLGFEFLAFDNVTLAFDMGYRYLDVNNYTASGGFASPQGQVAQGAPIKNADGTNRDTNLSGGFASVNFRFYFY